MANKIVYIETTFVQIVGNFVFDDYRENDFFFLYAHEHFIIMTTHSRAGNVPANG